MPRPEMSSLQPILVVEGTENLDDGNKKVAVLNTAVALSATSVPFKWCIVQALPGNAGDVAIGGSDITIVDGSEEGTQLLPYTTLKYLDGDLSQLHINGAAGDGVCWQVNKK